jgi:hypothetical protein
MEKHLIDKLEKKFGMEVADRLMITRRHWLRLKNNESPLTPLRRILVMELLKEDKT